MAVTFQLGCIESFSLLKISFRHTNCEGEMLLLIVYCRQILLFKSSHKITRLRKGFQEGKHHGEKMEVWGFISLCFYFEVSLCSETCCLRLCFGKNLDYLQLSCESTERMRMNFVKLAHSQSGTPCALCGCRFCWQIEELNQLLL